MGHCLVTEAMVPAEANWRMNMGRAVEKTIEMTNAVELSHEQLETVTGGEFQVVRVVAIRADGTNIQMWTTSVTKK